MGGSSPSSLVTGAALVRLEVYGAGVHCAGAVIAPGAGPADVTRTFRKNEPITMDVAPGAHALELTTYADAEATQVIGRGCTETNLSPGAQICFDLTLAAVSLADGGGDGDVSDGGDGDDLACAGGTTTLTDPSNCGSCGARCSTSHIAASCAAGVCNGACSAGFDDCNADKRSDGCETQLNSVMHCGACGAVCSIGTDNSARACNGTACSYTCAGGRLDCNAGTGHNTDGCECAGGTTCCPGINPCPVQHDNGAGDKFYDCTPINTYTQAEAVAACQAFAKARGRSAQQAVNDCEFSYCNGDPSNPKTLVCSDGVSGSGLDCYCWGYGTATANTTPGYVSKSCSCTDNTDTPWH